MTMTEALPVVKLVRKVVDRNVSRPKGSGLSPYVDDIKDLLNMTPDKVWVRTNWDSTKEDSYFRFFESHGYTVKRMGNGHDTWFQLLKGNVIVNKYITRTDLALMARNKMTEVVQKKSLPTKSRKAVKVVYSVDPVYVPSKGNFTVTYNGNTLEFAKKCEAWSWIKKNTVVSRKY